MACAYIFFFIFCSVLFVIGVDVDFVMNIVCVLKKLFILFYLAIHNISELAAHVHAYSLYMTIYTEFSQGYYIALSLLSCMLETK